ncbi:tetratricopeptide repeat protein [Aliikangiella sp. G2MR2-5]|uniref:tetratricopeptide repeat protein n=1 Tax=Aliikangiella sp. G2MR2-5 TaxID=2788943 RepID=UPI0018A9F02E|nr:tetratricopeptide repeat protein [Aliikangiella sp. G2MR2-5]
MENSTFIHKLLKRRVPQILGAYIAVTWMLIEIGDWMVERFGIPESVTSYIFIGMVFFIPSVFYLSYQYGKPGRDPWHKVTFYAVPLNIIVSCVAMFYLVNPVVATEMKTVTDEQGKVQSFEVAKKEYQRTILSYFWKNNTNDASLDWMQYGFAWILNKELDRNLFIHSDTPFNYSSILTKAKNSGFPDIVNLPRSLKTKLARDRYKQYFIDGSFDKENEQYVLSVEVFDIAEGHSIASLSASGNDYFELLEELSTSIRSVLNIPRSSGNLKISEYLSESHEAIEQFIKSYLKQVLENDYQEAKVLLEKAIALDFSFVDALGRLAFVQRVSGNTQEAEKSIKQALVHQYKMTPQEQFQYKAKIYGVKGDYESEVKVYDMWLELYPDDIDALKAQSKILLIVGMDHEKTLKSLTRLRELMPDDFSVLTSLSDLYVLRQQLVQAANTLESLLDNMPQSVDVMLKLADVYNRMADFDKSVKLLEKIILLEPGNLTAQLQLVRINLKLGQLVEAKERLDGLLADAKSDNQKFTLLGTYLQYYSLSGKFDALIDMTYEMAESSSHLTPALKLFAIDFQRGMFWAAIGEFEKAFAQIEEIRSKLQPPLDGLMDAGIVSILSVKKDFDAAKETIVKLKAYFKKYPNPIMEATLDSALGFAAQASGDAELAITHHRKALEKMTGSIINSLNEDAILQQKIVLAEAIYQSGNKEEAEKLLDEVIIHYPSMPLAWNKKLLIALDANDMVEAENAINKIEKVWQSATPQYIEYQKYLRLLERYRDLAKLKTTSQNAG